MPFNGLNLDSLKFYFSKHKIKSYLIITSEE